MEVAFKSDVGKIRSHNEDNGGYSYNDDGFLLAIVADGMGGHQAGEVASLMTIQLMMEEWKKTKGLATPASIETWLKEVITDINVKVYQHSIENDHCQGMGTTLVAVVCSDQFITYAHIGDSRLYLLNEQVFSQKTQDHTYVNELLSSGQISAEEAEKHPRRNVILRALGTEKSIKIDIETINWEKDSILLLCSDGLSDKVNNEEIKDVLQKDQHIEQKIFELITLANERGGEDNISIAIVHNSIEDSDGDVL